MPPFLRGTPQAFIKQNDQQRALSREPPRIGVGVHCLFS
jgi:hypothetical protein